MFVYASYTSMFITHTHTHTCTHSYVNFLLRRFYWKNKHFLQFNVNVIRIHSHFYILYIECYILFCIPVKINTRANNADWMHEREIEILVLERKRNEMETNTNTRLHINPMEIKPYTCFVYYIYIQKIERRKKI